MTQERNIWYIERGGQRYGPYTTAQMKEFATSGHLLPIDLVQRDGMEQPVIASQIKGLFPAESVPVPPPPKPRPRPVRVQPEPDEDQVEEVVPVDDEVTPSDTMGFTDIWAKVWSHKLWFLSGLLLFTCLGNTCLMSVATPSAVEPPHPFVLMVGALLGLISLGLLITVVVLGFRKFLASEERASRRNKLHGAWEPVTGQGLAFQFTEDGGMIRSDGLATHYRWLADDKEIELYEDGVDETVRFKIITLSRDELVLKTGGQAAHFRRGTTISEEEMQRRREESMESLRKVGAGIASVAGGAAVVAGAAAVLALGGLAVLCGAAAAGSSGQQVVGGSGPRSPGLFEFHCKDCRSVVDPLAKRCPYCGGTNLGT